MSNFTTVFDINERHPELNKVHALIHGQLHFVAIQKVVRKKKNHSHYQSVVKITVSNELIKFGI